MSPGRPGIPRSPLGKQPPLVPLERGRAAGMLTGLLLFGLGFVVAAAIALTGHAGSAGYLAAAGAGFFGVGVVAFFLNRGTVPLPEGPIWSRVGLTRIAGALDLPARAVIVTVYGLIAVGIIGNIVVPVVTR